MVGENHTSLWLGLEPFDAGRIVSILGKFDDEWQLAIMAATQL